MTAGPRVLVIGVGNRFRSDDGAGLEATRRLRGTVPSDVRVTDFGGDGASLFLEWTGADAVIVIDAVRSGAEPGTVHRIDARERGLPPAFHGCSTHGFGLAGAIEMARSMGRLPRTLVFYGIEGRSFDYGPSVGDEVRRSVDDVVARVRSDIESMVEGSHGFQGSRP